MKTKYIKQNTTRKNMKGDKQKVPLGISRSKILGKIFIKHFKGIAKNILYFSICMYDITF